MSFWEELGQRITNRSRDAVQKTKNIADIMTMDADISDSKRKIKDLHEELGRKLVEDAFSDLTSAQIKELLEKNSPESLKRAIDFRDWADLLTKVMYIKSEEEVIALNEKKIKALSAGDVCPSCGRKVKKNMAFCPDCGTRIIRPEVQEPEPAAESAEAEPVEKSAEEAEKSAWAGAATEPVGEPESAAEAESVEKPAEAGAVAEPAEDAGSPAEAEPAGVVPEQPEDRTAADAADADNGLGDQKISESAESAKE
ncbi:MAG TPA: hypothetical protein DCF49_04360 [Lachnospiraceae bacterium]|nr:hypothetical protein [Lachnospiraceae bacterium]